MGFGHLELYRFRVNLKKKEKEEKKKRIIKNINIFLIRNRLIKKRGEVGRSFLGIWEDRFFGKGEGCGERVFWNFDERKARRI